MDVKLDEGQARGVRILTGEEATLRRGIIDDLVKLAKKLKYDEVMLPCVEPAQLYVSKAGPEILSQMYVFKDKGDRDLCLRPEGTATCQLLANTIWKQHKDVRIFYEARCWRYERPQAGRYREFTQFGVEWLWPRDPKQARQELIDTARMMIAHHTDQFEVSESVKRGLAYYVEDGFEISIPSLGAQKQVLGGGAYAEGIGFAIGVDRLLLALQNKFDAMDRMP